MQPLDISYLYLSDIGKSKHEIITRLQQLSLIDGNYQATGKGVDTGQLGIKTTSVWNPATESMINDQATVLTALGIIYIPVLFEDKFYKDMSASQNLVERACDGELLTIKELRKQGYLK